MGKLVKLLLVVIIIGGVAYFAMQMINSAESVDAPDRPAVSPEEKVGVTIETP